MNDLILIVEKKMKLNVLYLGSQNYVMQDKANYTKKANYFQYAMLTRFVQ